MWWEMLPSLSMIGGALILPHIFTPVTNYLVHGNMHKRHLFYFDDANMYLRDERLTGSVFKQNNLDCCDLEDVPIVQQETQSEKKCEC